MRAPTSLQARCFDRELERMSLGPRITVSSPEGEKLNGLGMMMVQYLEQNFADFEHKIQQGCEIRSRVSVEVEKGVAITISFEGERIQIENGIGNRPDLLLRSSYITLSEVLSGKAGPLREILKGNVKLGTVPRKPIQAFKVLRFLKIPPELLLHQAPRSRKRQVILGAVLAGAFLSLAIFLSSKFL
jgi:hypothetical protein